MPFVPFGQVRSLEGLAANLSSSVADLTKYATDGDQRPFYRRIQIPKKGKRRGQLRTVYMPEQGLGLIQKILASWITTYTVFDPCVQGFVHGRSIVTNARLHLAQPLILHADIQGFFDAIRIERVEEALRAIGCEATIAAVLARITTLNGQLPQGSSASPCLANLAVRHLDADFQVLATGSGCRYSRYADDIVISGAVLPAEADVAALIAKHGFVVREGKCRVQPRGHAQFVTGLTVAEHEKPYVPRARKRRLRLEMYYAAKFGLGDHLMRTESDLTEFQALARLRGWIDFIYSVEGSGRLFEQYCKVRDQFHGRAAGIPGAG
jgi:RNA-directed DNA polymerase